MDWAFEAKLVSIEVKIDHILELREARAKREWDSKMQKLLIWARRVSEKTGVPLEDS